MIAMGVVVALAAALANAFAIVLQAGEDRQTRLDQVRPGLRGAAGGDPKPVCGLRT